MPNRTPSFVVVGLVIVVCLLGSFYMSCSSKTMEFRQIVNDLEERVRTLTLKNGGNEKTIESLTSRKLQLRKEKLELQRQLKNKDLEIQDLNRTSIEKFAEIQKQLENKDLEIKELNRTSNEKLAEIQKQLENKDLEIKDLNIKLNEKLDTQQQLEKKDLEINDLRKKLNEKFGEIHRLNVDKEVIQEQLESLNKDSKNNREILASKTSKIGNLQQDLYEQKQSKDGQITQLKQDIENYKARLNSSRYNQENVLQTSTQPIPLLLAANETIKNSSALVQQPSAESKGQKQNDSELPQRLQLALDNKLFNNTQFNAEHAPIPIDLILLSRVNETKITNNQSQLSAEHAPLPADHILLSHVNETNIAKNQSQLLAEHAPIPIDHVLLSRVNETNIANNQSQLSADDKNYRSHNRENSGQIRKLFKQLISN